jgi:EAL domain-containing protein (putative c-di-GMP-specific phosphodiesterase class I)
VRIIKLDRGLTGGSEPDRIETLYRSVIRLCDALDLAVIAVGIESTAQADTVYTAGTRMATGICSAARLRSPISPFPAR